jgi:hypothetical protein
MPCECTLYRPIELDRQSVNRRIKQSPGIRNRLTPVAENTKLRLELFRCSNCGQLWQSGHEWNFADQEYLFQVPEIGIQEWETEPYQQPAAMLIYSAVMRDFFARSKFEVGTSPCRIKDCDQSALQLSVFCRDHHIESMQQQGRLPKAPAGRIFPPYFVESQDKP